MSSIIELLERMGKDSVLSESTTEFEKAINQSDLNTSLKKALMDKNVNELVNQLDVCPEVVCALLPADEDENEEDQQQEDSNITCIS